MQANSVLREVADLRDAARRIRNNAVIDKDLQELAEAREELAKAIILLEEERKHPTGESAEAVVKRLYQCLGSVGGTWRDAAILSATAAEKDKCWAKSIRYYDEGYQLERGADPRSEAFKFDDSYNLVQRLIVRVLRQPKCQFDHREDVGSGLDVPARARDAQNLIRQQLSPGEPRVGDAWAMADLAELQILFEGASLRAAWRDFDEEVRSAEAYETNYRAFTALMIEGKRCDEPLGWLRVVEQTVSWLSQKLQKHHGIEVAEGVF